MNASWVERESAQLCKERVPAPCSWLVEHFYSSDSQKESASLRATLDCSKYAPCSYKALCELIWILENCVQEFGGNLEFFVVMLTAISVFCLFSWKYNALWVCLLAGSSDQVCSILSKTERWGGKPEVFFLLRQKGRLCITLSCSGTSIAMGDTFSYNGSWVSIWDPFPDPLQILISMDNQIDSASRKCACLKGLGPCKTTHHLRRPARDF